VRWLKANGNARILVEGHCDERGSAEYNLGLGDRRPRRCETTCSPLASRPTESARSVTGRSVRSCSAMTRMRGSRIAGCTSRCKEVDRRRVNLDALDRVRAAGLASVRSSRFMPISYLLLRRQRQAFALLLMVRRAEGQIRGGVRAGSRDSPASLAIASDAPVRSGKPATRHRPAALATKGVPWIRARNYSSMADVVSPAYVISDPVELKCTRPTG